MLHESVLLLLSVLPCPDSLTPPPPPPSLGKQSAAEPALQKVLSCWKGFFFPCLCCFVTDAEYEQHLVELKHFEWP